MSPTTHLAPHALRLAACLAALVAAAQLHDALVVVASIAVFMAAFAANHDLVHDALGVPKAWRAPLIALAGSLMLTSGHAIRTMHLIHHGHPLAADDVEGETARLPLGRALLRSPLIALRYRIAALHRAGRRDRRWHLIETAINVGVALAALMLGGALLIHVAVAQALVLSMPFWAGHVPHRAPEALIALARRFSVFRSPVALSLAFHDLHHVHPRVPCHRLAELAR